MESASNDSTELLDAPENDFGNIRDCTDQLSKEQCSYCHFFFNLLEALNEKIG